MSKKEIDENIQIEDLVNDYPFSVRYLSEKGIRCIVCGEPIWGTLEEAAKQKGFDDNTIKNFIYELRSMI